MTFISLGIACFLQYILFRIQSDFVYVFLKSNITNLQIALLAINVATLSIVLTKIRELSDRYENKNSFELTRGEMLLSIKEQIGLIVASLLIISLETSKTAYFHFSSNVFQALLLTSFIYSLLILYDTAQSVFIILDY